MKIVKSLLCVVVLSIWTTAATSAPVFSGIFTSGGTTYLGLREDPAKPFMWVAVGGRLGEFRVVSYDDNAEKVVLQRGDAVVELRLKSSAVESTPTVELVERLAREGDVEMQKLLPGLRKLDERRADTVAELAALERRAATDESVREELKAVRRKHQIEDDNLRYLLRSVLNPAKSSGK